MYPKKQPKNEKQDELMVAFMKANPDVAAGYSPSTKVVFAAKWQKLVNDLNLEGPPKKNITAWKKVWHNRKVSVRRKFVKNQGAGLTAIEESVAIACGMFQDEKGLAKPGLKKEPMDEDEFLSEDEDKENAEEMEKMEPKPKPQLLNPIRRTSTGSQFNSAESTEAQSSPMPEILRTLQEMTAQQAGPWRQSNFRN